MAYIEDIDDYIEDIDDYIEDTDDYIQMNEPADYYKDEYGICPCCKHKLSKEEMKRKRCSKCLQKLSGKTGAFTRKGLSNLMLGIIAIPIMLLFVICIVTELNILESFGIMFFAFLLYGDQ